MFDSFKRDIRAQKFFSTAEEAMYFEQAAKAVANGEIQPGIYAMALSKCEGDEVKANAMYLQLRVDMLKQEAAVGEQIAEAAGRMSNEAAQREANSRTNFDQAIKNWLRLLILLVVVAIFFTLVAIG